MLSLCIKNLHKKGQFDQGRSDDAKILQTVLKRGLRRRWQYQSANKMSW